MNRKLMTLTFMVLMAGLMLSAPMARANSLDTLTFTLTNLPPQQQYHTGDVLNFFGIITAPITNTDAQNLDGISTTINPLGSFALDITGFLNNTPLFLNPGETTGEVLLFTETLTSQSPTTNYALIATLIYDDPSGLKTVDASGGRFTFPVPEPASMFMVGAGLTGLASMIRRKR